MLAGVDRTSPDFPAVTLAPTMHAQVQEAIREMIISGQLRPGALLTPSALAEVMNTSATPIREALRVLQQEGLVEIADRRFTRVATPRRTVADEAYPLISLLESKCIRERDGVFEDLLAQAEQANLEMANAESTSQRLHAALRFHRLLCANAGPITTGFLQTLYAKVALLEISYHAKLFHENDSADEHAQIIDRIRAGRFQDAAEVLERHWARGQRDVIALLDDEQASGQSTISRLPAATRPSRQNGRSSKRSNTGN